MDTSSTSKRAYRDIRVSTRGFKHRFSLNISERKLLLVVIDLILVSTALLLSLLARGEIHQSVYSWWNSLLWFVFISVVWVVFATILQLYTLSITTNLKHSVGRATIGSLLTAGVYLILPYITPAFPTSRHELLLFPSLCVIGMVCWRSFYVKVLVQPELDHRTLLVGSGRSVRQLMKIIQELAPSNRAGQLFGYDFVGFVNDEETPTSESTYLPQLGMMDELREIIHKQHPHELILSDEIVSALTRLEIAPGRPQRRRYDSIHMDVFNLILECREMGIDITTAATVYEHMTGRVPVEQLARSLNMALPLDQPATYRLYLISRRLLDIGVSLVGCLILAIVLPVVWLANLLSSPGPLFYAQERVGEGGRIFAVLKFRSMVVDAEKHVGAVWASENDPRITRIGHLLRKTRLDEVPQFWNILKGDMSLIGPRPERPQFVNQLARDIPFYRARHALKPGLTGWAQVCYRYGASLEDSLMKLQYDLYYVKHVSLFMDIQIMLLTIPVVLGFKGR